ncbi:MAG: SusC/RagA family TonB-linked outer membrane protein [Breznakibacter sp.]
MNLNRILLAAMALLFACSSLVAQNEVTTEKLVSGRVFDATTLKPVEIASVTCGTYSSTFTDMDGSFDIKVPNSMGIVSVNALGYHSKEVVVSGRDSIKIYLKEIATASLQQKANIGYFDVKQIYTPQSVAFVQNLDDKTKTDIGSADKAFDGRIAGLEVVARNGIKGMGSDMFLRGFTSLNATNQPLVVVDGMIYDINNYGSSLIPGNRFNPLAGIDLQDIESVSVIRDAASIYGAKAANGVILIRTKHAVEQATSIDFVMNGAIEIAPENIPLLGAEDFRLLANEMLLSQGLSAGQIESLPYMNNDPGSNGYYTYRNNTDWQKKVFANNYSSNLGLSIKGGDDVALYALSVGYLNQGGTVKESGLSRFNLRFNSDINISKRVTLNSNIGFYYLEKNITGVGIESIGDPLAQARIKAPFLQPYVQNDQGIASPDLADYDLFNVSNPVALVEAMKQKDSNYRFSGSFNFNVKANEKLTFSNLVGIVFNKNRENIFIPGNGVPPDTLINGVVENQLKERVFRYLSINNDSRVSYDNTFCYLHSLSGVVGARLNINNMEDDWGADFNSANDQILTLGGGNYLLRQKGGSIGEWSSLTYYANINYDYAKKYFLGISAALDGSSRFGEKANGLEMFDTRFGFFPSVAGAWLLTSEPFMANQNLFETLKLRASYGLTGNDDIGNYTSRRYYTEVNYLVFQGIRLGNIWNPKLSYEKNYKLNFGADIALAKERLNLSVDVFNNKTTDMFDLVVANVLSGMDGYYANVGGFTTTGVDLHVNTRLLNRPVRWDMGIVLQKYVTKVDELWDQRREQTIYGANILTQEGEPLGLFYGYKTKGVFATSADAANSGLKDEYSKAFGAGDVIFEDFYGDGIIDEKDKQVIGDPTPDFSGEFYTRLKCKSFTLDASLGFSVGGDVFNYMRYSLEKMDNLENQTQAVLNRWQYEGQVTDMPKATYGDPMGNARFSDRWIEDGSYARLKNVTLSYLIPIKFGFFKRAEIYASAINLVTFTKYKGLDPEFSMNGYSLSRGIDLGLVPQNKAFLVGIKIGL